MNSPTPPKRARLRQGLARLIWLGVIGSLLIAVLGMFGGQIPTLDAFSHFRPLMTAGSLFLLLLALIVPPANKKAMAATAFIAVFLHGWPVALEAQAALKEPHGVSAQNRTLRLITYNAHGAYRDAEATRKFIESEAPDILVLQEIYEEGAEVFAALSPMFPHRVDCIGEHSCNLALLSKHPIQASRVFSRYAKKPDVAPVQAIVAEIDAGDTPVNVVVTHLSWPLPAARQRDQMAFLSDLANGLTGPAILAGDFNSTPWSQALSGFDSRLSLKRLTRFLTTWPTRNVARLYPDFPFLAIDHVFASPELRATNVRRGPSLGSDHYPVIVDLTSSKNTGL